MTEVNTSKDTNPKDAVGVRKWRQFMTVPRQVIMELGVAMLEGTLKYGRHNYRASGVRASVYYDAAMGHLEQWVEGEDVDADSGLNHITKAIASLVVLRDAMMNDFWEDDRPPKIKDIEALRSRLQAKVEENFERYADKDPHHYQHLKDGAKYREGDAKVEAMTLKLDTSDIDMSALSQSVMNETRSHLLLLAKAHSEQAFVLMVQLLNQGREHVGPAPICEMSLRKGDCVLLCEDTPLYPKGSMFLVKSFDGSRVFLRTHPDNVNAGYWNKPAFVKLDMNWNASDEDVADDTILLQAAMMPAAPTKFSTSWDALPEDHDDWAWVKYMLTFNKFLPERDVGLHFLGDDDPSQVMWPHRSDDDWATRPVVMGLTAAQVERLAQREGSLINEPHIVKTTGKFFAGVMRRLFLRIALQPKTFAHVDCNMFGKKDFEGTRLTADDFFVAIPGCTVTPF